MPLNTKFQKCNNFPKSAEFFRPKRPKILPSPGNKALKVTCGQPRSSVQRAEKHVSESKYFFEGGRGQRGYRSCIACFLAMHDQMRVCRNSAFIGLHWRDLACFKLFMHIL
jgi:hypothetical protein